MYVNSRFIGCAVAVSVVAATAANVASPTGPEIRLNPVAGTGNVICTPGQGACGETQIILSEGGVTVTIFVEVSGWDPDQDGDPTLGAVQAAIDWDTYDGGDSSGEGTAYPFNLVPVGSPSHAGQGIFQALEVCTDTWPPDMTDPLTRLSVCGHASTPDCPPSHPFCLDRPDYVFYGLDNFATVSTHHGGVWSASSPECAVDPDGGVTKFYLGTLRLDVPLGAVGTYNVNYIDYYLFTGLWNCAETVMPRNLTPAQITILPGTADCNANGVPDENEADDDSDGVINACDGCPNDPNKIVPGNCGCGIAYTDADCDGVPDGEDLCPNVDDNIFGPGCVGAIPTVSAWGLVIIALVLLIAAKVGLYRRAVSRHIGTH